MPEGKEEFAGLMASVIGSVNVWLSDVEVASVTLTVNVEVTALAETDPLKVATPEEGVPERLA
jgi:hypothetical protein